MLGFHALSEAPISALAGGTSSGEALGEAFATAVSAHRQSATASAEGNATASGPAQQTFRGVVASFAEAVTQGAANITLFGSGPIEGNAHTSGDATFMVFGNATAEANALASGNAFRVRRVGGAALGEAFLDAISDLFKNVINPSLSGGLVDISNLASFKLTVDGDVLDFSTPFWNADQLDISYDGKELTFSEIASPGIGVPSYAPEHSVLLDVDFTGSGSTFQRIFTGAVRRRNHEGVNNEEWVRYTALGNFQLANEITLLNTNGRPEVIFTVGTSVTTTTSLGSPTIVSFSKSIRSAVQELFEIHASQLNTLGIPATIGNPGLLNLSGQLPETVNLKNTGLIAGINQVVQYQTGVKLFFDDASQTWILPNLLTVPTAIVKVNSVNLQELMYDATTEDRYTAIKLYPEFDTTIEDTIVTKSATITVNGNVGFLSRTVVDLSPSWITSLQLNWTILKGNAAFVNTIEDEFYWVYRRWALPEELVAKHPGTPVKMYQLINYFNQERWRPLNGKVLFKKRQAIARFPTFHRGNPYIPGDVLPPLEVKLAYYPLNLDFTRPTSTTSEGEPTAFVTTPVDQTFFQTPIRYPSSGFSGTAFTTFGVERELVEVVDATEVTTENAINRLELHKDVVFTGDLPIDGDPIETLIHLQRKVRVQHSSNLTGIDSLSAFLTQYSYQFGKRGTSQLTITTDQAGLIRQT